MGVITHSEQRRVGRGVKMLQQGQAVFCCVTVCSKRIKVVCVFQRAHHSAGGWAVQLQVRSRISGVGLCLEAISVPVACNTTAWILITTVTVMLTTNNGTVFLIIYFAFNSNSPVT